MIKKILSILILSLSFSCIAAAQPILTDDNNFGNLVLEPGDTYNTTLTLKNAYTLPHKYELLPVDGATTKKGGLAAKLAESEQLHFGKWATLDKYIVELDPKETTQIRLTIKIPENATPSDYVAAITVAKADQDAKILATPGFGISAKTRNAYTFYLSIPGEKIQKLEIGELAYSKTNNEYKGFLPLYNKGNTSIAVHVNPTLTALFGETKELELKEITILPSSKIELPIMHEILPILGSYNLSANVQYSEINLVNKVEKPIGEKDLSLQIIIIPWLYVLLIAALILIIVGYATYKKMNLNNIIKNSAKYSVQKGDTISNIAQENKVNWKTLIKINKLKAPYELKAGQKILLPKEKK